MLYEYMEMEYVMYTFQLFPLHYTFFLIYKLSFDYLGITRENFPATHYTNISYSYNWLLKNT